MTIPERVKDILEEIANQNFHWDYTPIWVKEEDGILRCHCPSCLATEALRIIAEEGEKISPQKTAEDILDDFNVRYVLADAHWDWVRSLCEKMYKEAFVHGFKHGVEHKNPSRNEKWDDEHISEM